jgi:hypothetical protein
MLMTENRRVVDVELLTLFRYFKLWLWNSASICDTEPKLCYSMRINIYINASPYPCFLRIDVSGVSPNPHIGAT